MSKYKIKKPLIVGAGGVGTLLALMLNEIDMQVTLLDSRPASKNHDEALKLGVTYIVGDATNKSDLENIIKNHDAVISCLPYHLTALVAMVAHELNVHYFDPTEDMVSTNLVRDLAKNSKSVMIPQCGLAPGFVGIVGAHLLRSFETGTVRKLSLRVGALPLNPVGELGYACNWSPEGLVHQCLEQADVIKDGTKQKISAGTNIEKIRINGVEYEAFCTAGGLGTMTETYVDSVHNLDYKSIRYPGHTAELNRIFNSFNRDNLAIVPYMKDKYPPDSDDRVLVHVSGQGIMNGRFQTKSFVADYRPLYLGLKKHEAIFWTTAASIAAVVELVSIGKLSNYGFVKQEEISLIDILTTRHGQLFSNNNDNIRVL